MAAVRKSADKEASLEEVEEILRKGQSFIMSEDDGLDYKSLSKGSAFRSLQSKQPVRKT